MSRYRQKLDLRAILQEMSLGKNIGRRQFGRRQAKQRLRLVVHAGLHKTATTSFQNLCRENHGTLVKNGIFFPLYKGWGQHSYAAWLLQQRRVKQLREFLAYSITESGHANTILLSGEDFENCLVDFDGALTFQNEALCAGFDEVLWAFVHRDPIDYLLSIYAEMSKHGVVLSLETLMKAATKSGYISVSTQKFNYHFVFNPTARIDEFKKKVCRNSVLIEHQSFLKPIPGLSFLEQIIGGQADFSEIFESTERANVREDDLTIERRYARTSLNSQSTKVDLELVDQIAHARLASRQSTIAQLTPEFKRQLEVNNQP